MRGLVVDARGALSLEELPMPEIGAYQARVRMLACGVCNGTDQKLIHRAFKNFDSYPAVLGHEGVGEVVAVGERVRSLRLGDRVLLPFLEGMSGGFHSGWGAYAEYAVVGDAAAYAADGLAVPSQACLAQTVLQPQDRVDAVSATMIITFREVLAATRRFGFAPNRSLIVYGCGPVGLSFIRFARLLGMGPVLAVDIEDGKVAAALAMGADAAFNSTACDADAALRAALPQGADFVLDAVGVNALINRAMGLIADHGRICCYGISPELTMTLDWAPAPYNWSLHFVQWPAKAEEGEAHRQVMAWINLGVLDPAAFISDIIPFEEALRAFALLAQKRPGTQKIVIDFTRAGGA